MEPLKPRKKKRPEDIIRDAIYDYMRLRGWYVMKTHGSMYQSGFPDLWTTHRRYGPRWVEIKKPGMKGSVFTPAQMDCFPQICANGSGVWILTAATESEYNKLFERYNWHTYLMK